MGSSASAESMAERLYAASGTTQAIERPSGQLLPAVDALLRQQALNLMDTKLQMQEADMAWAGSQLEVIWPTVLEWMFHDVQKVVAAQLRRDGVALIEQFSPDEQRVMLNFFESPLGKMYVAAGLAFQGRVEGMMMPGGLLEKTLQSHEGALEQAMRKGLKRPSKTM